MITFASPFDVSTENITSGLALMWGVDPRPQRRPRRNLTAVTQAQAPTRSCYSRCLPRTRSIRRSGTSHISDEYEEHHADPRGAHPGGQDTCHVHDGREFALEIARYRLREKAFGPLVSNDAGLQQ